tara:strand:+ start:2209 stop:2430 length:222 start_codon:yes stop_codon:yes gene_type:complete
MIQSTKDFFASLRRNANAVQKLEKPKHLADNHPEKEANRQLVRAISWNASREDFRKPVSNVDFNSLDFSKIRL